MAATPIHHPLYNPIASTSYQNQNHHYLPPAAKFRFNMSVSASSSSIQGEAKNSNSLRRPLTSTDLTGLPYEGSPILRVAYQGVPGAYSESAAGKAYPNCEAVPCEHFENAFEAVERWIVDRAVLPIENSLGGSIHRNYDLLLRHRLHIVGEVKTID